MIDQYVKKSDYVAGSTIPLTGLKSFMKDMEGFVCRYNSYSGFLAWKRTYKIRCKIWNNVSEYIKDYVYIRNNKSSIVLKKEYRVLTKYKKRKNDLQHIYKRRFQRNRTI